MSLRASQRDALRALGNILIPPGGALPPSASDAGVPARIEGYLDLLPRRLRRTLSLLITAWDLGPVAARGFGRPFHRLDSERQHRWVARADASRRPDLGLPFAYLKQLIFLTYAASPQVEEALGYDYTCRLEGEPHGRREP